MSQASASYKHNAFPNTHTLLRRYKVVLTSSNIWNLPYRLELMTFFSKANFNLAYEISIPYGAPLYHAIVWKNEDPILNSESQVGYTSHKLQTFH